MRILAPFRRAPSLLVIAIGCIGGLAAPAAHADWTASGTFLYRDRIQDLTGFTGVTETRPIRYARVEIVRAPNFLLASGATDENGNFEIPVPDAQTASVFCRVISIDNIAVMNIRVQSSATVTTTYAVAGATIPSHPPTTSSDFGIAIAEPFAGGEAFNILDVMVDGSEYVATLTGTYPTSLCTTVWNGASTTGTYFSGSTIWLLSDEGYDDSVIGHEHSHFIDFRYSKSSNPGGPHFLGDNNQDIRLAWGEGVASYHMAAARKMHGRPRPNWYIDTTGGPGSGYLNFSYEMEEPNVSAIGAASEVSVQAVLYDVIDDADDDLSPCDDDGNEFAIADVWNVMRNYLPLVPVVSLEDFWDGWFSPGIDLGHLDGLTYVFSGLHIEFFADTFEPDPVSGNAGLIPATGKPQFRTFYPAGDVDWARFTSPGAGTQFVVETTNLLSDGNTQIAIVDLDGTTVLASNANRGSGDESSLLVWTAPGAGDYFVKIEHEIDYGVYGTYSLRVIQGVASAVNFTNVAVQANVASSRPGRGSAWGDYDNDGRPDLFVTNIAGNAWHLYHNNGGGTFTDVAPAAGVAYTGATGEQCVWGDYDNDGYLDLYVATIGTNLLYHNNQNGTFSSVGPAAGVAVGGNGSLGASWGDYDADGWLDLFVATIGADDVLFRNDGDGTFTNVTAATGVGGNGEDTFGGIWADYNADGNIDLFVHYDSSPNRLYRNDGGVFSDVTPPMMADRSVRSWGASWNDYDSDGDFDLFVSTLGAPCRLFRNIGSGRFSDVSAFAGVNLSGSQTGNVVQDFDSDGDQDIYMSAFDEPNIFLDNLTGTAFFRNGRAAFQSQSRSAASADYDGDGDLDISVVSGDLNNVLYANNGTAKPWIRLDLAGSTSNRAAIGATVTLRSAGRRQIQIVSGGSGYISQNDQALFFGLGGTAGPDTFDIRWPGGNLQTVTGLARNATHAILEAAGPILADETAAPGPARLRLAQNTPNPFIGVTGIAFEIPAPGLVRLEVLDIQGRRVATLIDRVMLPGVYTEPWDGRRQDGERAAAGVYFYRLEGAGGAATRKMLLRP